jgi:hypothetical protein
MNRSAGRDLRDGSSVCRLVAADVGAGRVLDALFGVGVLGLARCGPVFFFGFAVDDEFGEGVWMG